jgi:hypothetical protein
MTSINLSRRTLLLGGALLVIETPQVRCQAGYAGCVISGPQARSRLRGTARFGYAQGQTGGSGDPHLDRALALNLHFLSSNFAVLPGFAFIDGADAYASASTELGRPDGSVYFGRQLLRQVLQLPAHADTHLAAICAHEFAHICQFKNNLITRLQAGQSTSKQVELHADYLTGAFAGLRKLQQPHFPAAVVALAQYNAGSHQEQNPDHHGTPQERGQAVVEGYRAIVERRAPFQRVVADGIDYVLGKRL